MIRSNWQESSLDRNCKLTITDIHRLKDIGDLIKASKNKISILQQNPKSDIREVGQEKIILKSCRQIEDELKNFILFFDIQ